MRLLSIRSRAGADPVRPHSRAAAPRGIDQHSDLGDTLFGQSPDRSLGKPYGIFFAGNSRLLVADTAHKVVMDFDLDKMVQLIMACGPAQINIGAEALAIYSPCYVNYTELNAQAFPAIFWICVHYAYFLT